MYFTLIFLVFSSLNLQAEASVSSAPTCASKSIVFHGEMRWARMETNDQGKREMKKFREVLPLPDFHSIHSNSWKRIFIQVPPEQHAQVQLWSVAITFTEDSNKKGAKETQVFKFSNIENGFYPLKSLDFLKITKKDDRLMTGQLIFVIKKESQEICQFEMNLNGRGD